MTVNQILLSLKPHAQKTFTRFFPAGNEVIIEHLRQLSQPDTTMPVQQVYLWGARATGKSHLLQATCQASSQAGMRSSYIPFAEIATHGTQVLSGLENIETLCMDDMDVVLPDPKWQQALFHLMNKIHAHRGRLVMAGEENPIHLRMPFKDLHSRLVWGLVHGLRSLPDHHKYSALCTLMAHQDSTLTEEAAQYLLNNYSRDLGQLVELIEFLDLRAKQSRKNRMTIPFIKENLKAM